MAFDLLDAVLAPEGRYCIFGADSFPDQRFVDTREEAERIIQEFVNKQVDAFFGCAKFGPEIGRAHV